MSGQNQKELNITTEVRFHANAYSRPGTAPVRSHQGGRDPERGEGMGSGPSKKPHPDQGQRNAHHEALRSDQGRQAWTDSHGNGSQHSLSERGNGNRDNQVETEGSAQSARDHSSDHGEGDSSMSNRENPTSHADLPKQMSSKLEQLEAKTEVYYREEVYLAMKAEYLQYINKLQTQVTDQQDYKSKFKSEQKKVTRLEKRVEDLSENVTKLEEKLDAAEKSYNEEQERADDLNKEVKDLTERLSAEMSDKLSRDETSLENVSIRNRPLNVAEEYERFCQGDWLNAKQFLDKRIAEQYEMKKMQMLTDILMICHNKSSEMEKTIMGEMKQMLLDPFNVQESASQEDTLQSRRKAAGSADDTVLGSQRSKSKTPRSDRKKIDMPEKRLDKVTSTTLTAVSDHLRMTADDIDLSALVKTIRRHIKSVYGDDETMLKLLKLEQFTDYIRCCTQISWKMVIQRPPMTLETEGVKGRYNKTTQDVNYGSADPKAKDVVVVCYAHPALYHDKKLMQKGKVLLRPQKLK